MQHNLLAEKHQRAMDLAEGAIALRLRGDLDRAMPAFQEAFVLERTVAEAIAALPDRGVDSGVLCRSAATLALDCGQIGEAVRLARLGLGRTSEEELVRELNEVLARAQAS